MKLNNDHKIIIRKALSSLELYYDFENTTEREFKECYGVSKIRLKAYADELFDILELYK